MRPAAAFFAAFLLTLLLSPAYAQQKSAPPNEFDQNVISLSDQLEAAEGGSTTAMYNLGMRYATGDGVVQNMETAAKWIAKSAEGGDMDAQAVLGTMFQRGQGLPKDDGEAVKWYLSAARQGHRQSQYNLGAMYASGRGTHVNSKEAYFWLSLASTLPNADVEAMKSSVEGKLSADDRAEIARRLDDWRPEVRNPPAYDDGLFRLQ